MTTRRNISTLSILFSGLLAFSPVYADDLPPEFLQFILNDEAYIQAVNEKAKEINDTSTIQCTTVSDRERLVPDIVSDVTFLFPEEGKQYTQQERQEMKYPLSGQWIEHVRQNNCDVMKQLNILATALPATPPTLLSLNSGTTITDPYLQNKTEADVMVTAKIAEIDCAGAKEVHVVDTAFEGYYDQSYTNLLLENQGYGWQERWITSVCNQRVDVKIKFTPTSDNDINLEATLYDPSLASELKRRRHQSRD